MVRRSCILLSLLAGCHLVGGTDDLYVVDEQEGGGASSEGGAGGSAASGAGSSGEGGTDFSCDEAADCPLPESACLEPKCTLGNCEAVPAARDLPCDESGGTACNGEGQCVECTLDDHCDKSSICVEDACVASTCDDDTMGGTETDTDCGGQCPPCAVGEGCLVPEDCASHVCESGQCVACTEQSQCPSEDYCAETGDGLCHPEKGWTEPCEYDYECKSGDCKACPYCQDYCGL